MLFLRRHDAIYLTQGGKGDDIDDRSKQPTLMRRFVNIMISHIHTLDKHCPLRNPCDKQALRWQKKPFMTCLTSTAGTMAKLILVAGESVALFCVCLSQALVIMKQRLHYTSILFLPFFSLQAFFLHAISLSLVLKAHATGMATKASLLSCSIQQFFLYTYLPAQHALNDLCSFISL